jgi:hypothetical protein
MRKGREKKGKKEKEIKKKRKKKKEKVKKKKKKTKKKKEKKTERKIQRERKEKKEKGTKKMMKLMMRWKVGKYVRTEGKKATLQLEMTEGLFRNLLEKKRKKVQVKFLEQKWNYCLKQVALRERKRLMS